MNLTIPALKVLAANLFQYFRGLDRPAADEIFIPLATIKPDKSSDNTLYATLRYVVEYCGRKEHKVRIKFNVDAAGRFITNSWSYVPHGKN